MLRWLVCNIGRVFVKVESSEIDKAAKPGKILLIKSGALGDILMTTPLLRTLKKTYPKTEITYIIGEKFAEVLRGNRNVDEIITFDTKKLFKSNFITKFRYFRKLALSLQERKFDMCFILDKSYLANLFAYWCNIPVRIGFDRNGEGFPNTHNIKYSDVEHEIYYYLDLLKPLDLADYGTKIDIPVRKNHDKFADNFLKGNKIRKRDVLIGIAPAATKDPKKSSSPRVWPAENYADLAEKLVEVYNAKIIFFGGENDINSIANVQARLGIKTYNSAGLTKIKEAAALIKRCKVFVTHDSGLMHVASAVGVPVISIFGPTDPRRKAPLNKGSIYLWKGRIKCEKCEVYGKFPYCSKHIGTDSINPNEVLTYVDGIINR
jgi:lipopolysaccharide heptosyltransferase II